MQNETITVEYSGVSKNNPKFGSIKTNDNRWFSCPVGMLPQLPKGATVHVVTESKDYNGKQYNNIRGMAQANSVGQAPSTPTTTSSISREAAMAAMAVVGKLYEGTGQFPGRAIIAQQFLDAAMAWMDAEQAMKTYKDQGGQDPNDHIPF